MSSTPIRQLLKNYLQHKHSAAEKQRVENWYQEQEAEEPLAMNASQEAQVKEEIWALITPGIKTQRPPHTIRLNWLKTAAAILTIGSFVLLFWKTPGKSTGNKAGTNLFTTVTTAKGERKTAVLPDGTKVMLNSMSSIRIAADFTSKRTVQLIEGEVFFDVKHDASHPFLIKSGRLTTQVLGTAFNIRAYKQLEKMTIGVVRGKVGVRLDNQPSHFLIKGQQLAYRRSNQQIALMPLDEQGMAWQQGNLVLNDVSFQEMCVLMDKNFGIQVYTNREKLKTKHFTTTISTSTPAMKAIEVVAAIHQLKIKKRRNGIEIY